MRRKKKRKKQGFKFLTSLFVVLKLNNPRKVIHFDSDILAFLNPL